MHPIKVSILVTFYNQAHYVDRALSSIMSQNISGTFEVLVGDDGSTDNTREVVRQWVDKYPGSIKLLERTPEERDRIARFSGSQNRLNLLKHARGEYFIFLDGDDYYCDKEKISRQVAALDNNVGCVACSHAIWIEYPDGKREGGLIDGLGEGRVDSLTYWKKYYFHTDTLMIRKSIVKNLPLNLLEKNFYDNMLTLAILREGSIYYVPRCMSVYYNDGAGLWTGNKHIVNTLITVMNYDMYCIMRPEYEKITSKRFANYWHDLIKVRKAIDASDFAYYEEEAMAKSLKHFESWIHYNDTDSLHRLCLLMYAFRRSWKLIVREKLGHIYHMLVRKPGPI